MTDEVRWAALAKKKSELAILEAFRAFREHQIEPILIKGWAAARNYPPDKPRFYGDIDLAVAAKDYERALDLAHSAESGAKGVDVHRELRHLDTLDWNTIYARSELIPVDGGEIRILQPEVHLRVMCAHWLTNGGPDRDRLYDIYYAVENRAADFDWSTCLDEVTPNRRTWIVATIGLTHKYFGLSLDGLPFEEEAKDLPAWLIKCVEHEWNAVERLRGIDESITDRRLFIRQVRNRLPPNPIQSTVNCEGAFDHRSRLGYQVRDIFGRMIPSAKRLSRAVLNQYRWSKSQ